MRHACLRPISNGKLGMARRRRSSAPRRTLTATCGAHREAPPSSKPALCQTATPQSTTFARGAAKHPAAQAAAVPAATMMAASAAAAIAYRAAIAHQAATATVTLAHPAQAQAQAAGPSLTSGARLCSVGRRSSLYSCMVLCCALSRPCVSSSQVHQGQLAVCPALLAAARSTYHLHPFLLSALVLPERTW